MKRWLAAALCLLLLLTGCGREEEPELAFVYKGVQITVGAEAGPILYQLGAPLNCTQEPSCAFQGMDTTYYHGGIYITTFTREGTEYILRAWFADDTVTTREGLRIGQTRQEAEKIYGECFIGSTATIKTEKSMLILTAQEDVISAITYEAVFS